MLISIKENKDVKIIRSPNYNSNFNKHTGYFERWGRTLDEDPSMSPTPELFDIELTTVCHGIKGKLCSFCYKANSPKGTNMSLATFKQLMIKLPKHCLTQIAFGVDSNCTSNPDWFEIFKYTRELGIVPNVTVADITDDTADKLATVCGAVAVSRYDNYDVCYDTVKKLTDRGMMQVNIHLPIAKELLSNAQKTLYDRLHDTRLVKLNAIVMLSLKKKGRGINYMQLEQITYNQLVQIALTNNINFGMDSCSAQKAMEALKLTPNYTEIKQCIEPCESSLMSAYIDVNGKFFPCSFCPGTPGWEEGLDVVGCTDFIKDIWMHPRTVEFRKQLIKGGRKCPIYNI